MINLLFLIGFDNWKFFLLLIREMAMIAVDLMLYLTPIQFTCSRNRFSLNFRVRNLFWNFKQTHLIPKSIHFRKRLCRLKTR